MLRAVDSDENPPDVAYRVPWHVDRSAAPHYIVTNQSAEPAFRVRHQFVSVAGLEFACLHGDVPPGGSFAIDASSVQPSHFAAAIAWKRETNDEFVWSFADQSL